MTEPPDFWSPGILIVDDEPNVAYALQRWIQTALPNVRVMVETEPQTALGRLVQDRADVLIVDQVMGGMTGTEVLAHARRSAPHVQRILVTGHPTSVLDPDSLEEAQAVQVLLKPLQTKPFIDLLQSLLKRAPVRKRADRGWRSRTRSLI